MAVNGLTITQSNLNELTLDEVNSSASKQYWHRFLIENGASFDKEEVLKSILESINPLDLVPVKYSVSGKNSCFLARNCARAIEKFYLNSLAPIELKNKEHVVLSIQTCYIPIENFKVNMQFHLRETIEKRYDKSKNGYIDLTLFHREPELYDILFCPLSRPKFLLYVLSILKRILVVTSINLSFNEIENLKPLEVLQDFKGLLSLNLSNNKVCNTEFVELIGKAVPNLEEINLSENPICDNFESELKYVNWIKQCMPSLKRVDNVSLNYGIPNQQFWLCNNTSWPVVNEFIKHYFTWYDHDRKALEFTYEKDSTFSMTCEHSAARNRLESKLECCRTTSRNLLNFSNENNVASNDLYWNNVKIVECLCNLPKTKHDRYSFKVDVLHFQGTSIVLVVSGVFKAFQNSEVPEVKSFNRTFVLKKVATETYKITNDMYHVTNATKEEIENSFRRIGSTESKRRSISFRREEKRRKKIGTVANLTKMNYAYSKRCLQDCNWNVKKALEVFLEHSINSEIPANAFN